MKLIRRFFRTMLSDPGSSKASLGRIAFWLAFLVSLLHYKSFNAEWCALLTAILGYCYGNKLVQRPAAGEPEA